MEARPQQPIQCAPSPARSIFKSYSPWVFALTPVVLTFLVYLPVLGHPFVNWDDPPMVINNPYIRSLDFQSVIRMFTRFYAADWVPLSWLSLAVDFKLGGLNPFFYHFNSLLLHCLNTLLVFSITRSLLGRVEIGREGEGAAPWVLPAAFLTSLGFGLHPLHVESVAWASERKDVLYSFFYLLSLWVYLKYSAATGWRPWKYLLCLMLFVLSLLSKTMAVTLPLVFLALDLWPLGRWKAVLRQALLEKIPFILAAALAAGLTFSAQSQAKALVSTQTIPLDYRVMNACHSAAVYLFKLLFPIGLAAYYPIEFLKTFSPEYIFCALAVLLAFLACWFFWKSRPYWAVAWVYYLLTFSPVLGLVHSGGQAVMDHYTYLALLGPLLLLASAAAFYLSRLPFAFLLAAALFTGLMGWGTERQLSTWEDSVNLWENVRKVDASNVQDIVYERLADAYAAQGRWEEVLDTVNNSAEMNPWREPAPAQPPGAQAAGENRDYALNASLHALKGAALLRKGSFPEAMEEFKKDVQLDPGNAMGHRLLSYADLKLGDKEDALKEILQAIQLDPNLPGADNSLGAIYVSMGQYGPAALAFQRAVATDPQNMEYLLNLAGAYSLGGHMPEYIQTLKNAIALRPQDPGLYQRLGQAYLTAGDKASAAEVFDSAKRLSPEK